MQFQTQVLMFTKRHWKVLSFGVVSFLLAIAFSFLSTVPETQPVKAQAIAVPNSSTPVGNRPQLEDLLSLLPPTASSEPSLPGLIRPKPPATSSEISGSTSLIEINPPKAPIIKTPIIEANTQNTSSQKANTQKAKAKFGHLPYAEAKREDLRLAGRYGSRPEHLHRDAAQAYQAMVAAARQEGVQLMAISGFRDTQVQAELFAAQTTRQGSAALAAKISAPPGHSEHHTGYAIDIGDEGYPKTDVEETFEQTPAFRWLESHAGQFGFELSFPRGNAQGVTYEPWHWRFVGTVQAGQTFAQANGIGQ